MAHVIVGSAITKQIDVRVVEGARLESNSGRPHQAMSGIRERIVLLDVSR